jgi:ribosomal protein S4
MVKPRMATDALYEKGKHAEAQSRYHEKKLKTHQKIAVWVPKKSVAYFLKAFKRMQNKWGSE